MTSTNVDDTMGKQYAAGDRHGKPDHSPSISMEESSRETEKTPAGSTEKESLPAVCE